MSQADSEPITAETFAAFATFLGTPLPDDPIRALRILRAECRREVERLIEFLDATDGDPDLEDNADFEPSEDPEPSIGWSSMTNQAGRPRFGADHCDGDDLEHEHDGREPDNDNEPGADDEPSLGWTGIGIGTRALDPTLLEPFD